MSSNDCTYTNINHINCSTQNLLFSIFVHSIHRQMLSYIILGHYSVANGNCMHLKMNYKFNRCKKRNFKILQYLTLDSTQGVKIFSHYY